MLPHLRQFVRVRQALVGAEALGPSLTALLDNTQVGIIHLEQIIAANDRARNLLRHGQGMTDQGGALRARAPAGQPRLARLVAAALPTSNSPPSAEPRRSIGAPCCRGSWSMSNPWGVGATTMARGRAGAVGRDGRLSGSVRGRVEAALMTPDPDALFDEG